MGKGGLIVVGSTLPIWMAIMLAGTLIMMMLGYCNYYVPRDQKAKAEYLRSHHEMENQESLIYFSKRVDETVYLMIATVVVIMASVFFLLDSYKEVIEKISKIGFFGILIGVLVFLAVLFAAIMFLVVVAIASESEAIRGIQKYYWGHYQIPVIDINKIEPFMRKYPR